MKKPIAFLTCIFFYFNLFSQIEEIYLPLPKKDGGMPLMEALSKRKTSRSFSSKKKISMQQLSNLLWAGFGINREDGRRTAPSSRNKQETDIYVLMEKGTFIYNAKKNCLIQISKEDHRAFSGKQAFVKDAPVTLVFVADFDKMKGNDLDKKKLTASMDTAFISQNISLFCASEKLVTGVRSYIDRELLSKKLLLKTHCYITLAQSVGHKKN